MSDELRKLDLRLDLIRNATSKGGGAYLVSSLFFFLVLFSGGVC